MFIEDKLFDKKKANFHRLMDYGFKKKKDTYEYSTNFLNDNYKAYITVHKSGALTGKVYDLEMDDEYTLIRCESSKSEEVKRVKEAYKKLLEDIKKKCYDL
jgi:galactokinase/mevalonate kinase-like predicted kinase